MTSSRSERLVAGFVTVGVRQAQRLRTGFAGLAVVTFLAAAPVAVAYFQVPDDPSPRSGTAQVVAQGVVDIAAEDLRWQITERVAPPPANADSVVAELGFVAVDAGVMLIDDLASGEQFRLPAGEALLTRADTEQSRVALGSEDARYREIALVNAGSEAPQDGSVQFTSEPFAGLGARHDIDLLSDVLAPGTQLVIPSGAMPTLILIREGAGDVITEAGDVLSLGVGEAVALAGPLTVTAAEGGAAVAAVYTGPAVPRLALATGTPRAGRTVESAQEDAQPELAASPGAAAAEAEDESDEDGDGLSASREARAGTDAALADTDEDGLTDGQEVREFDSNPLEADSDGDGVLDGDEVAQGTNPIDPATGAVVEVPEEAAPPEEAPGEGLEGVAPDPAPEASTPGDSDGDGLEDAIENELGTDPFDTDTDDDGLTDGDEYYVFQTGTRNPDSDGDGIVDGDEAVNGTDPNDPNS